MDSRGRRGGRGRPRGREGALRGAEGEDDLADVAAVVEVGVRGRGAGGGERERRRDRGGESARGGALDEAAETAPEEVALLEEVREVEPEDARVAVHERDRVDLVLRQHGR